MLIISTDRNLKCVKPYVMYRFNFEFENLIQVILTIYQELKIKKGAYIVLY